MPKEPRNQGELGIELGTELSLQSDRLVHRLKGVFIGMDPKQCIIVRVSPEQFRGISPNYLWRSPVICRYVHQGRVFGFKSVFLDAISFPISALFLSYPENIECVELRQHARTECFLPGILVKPGAPEFETFILDISEGGCRCSIRSAAEEAFNALEPGDRISLQTSLGTQSRRDFQAEVRNIYQTDTRELLVGLQFLQLAGEDRGVLVQFILNTDAEMRARSFREFRQWQGHKLPQDLVALFLDSYQAEIGEGGSAGSVSLQVVMGLDFDARKDLIELCVATDPCEGSDWAALIDTLRQRGLRRCLFAVAGDRPGLAEAVSDAFPESDLQLCYRSLLARVRQATRPEDCVEAELRRIGRAQNFHQGLEEWGSLVERFRERYPDLCSHLEEKSFRYMVFLNLPPNLRDEFSGVSSIEDLFHTLDGFRHSSGGSFASQDDLLIKAFWANWRLYGSRQEPVKVVARNMEVLLERFEQVFLDRPNRTPLLKRTAGFESQKEPS